MDRLVMLGVVVLLLAESLLAPVFGPTVTTVAVLGPLVAVAFRAVAVRVCLSRDYRSVVVSVLARAARSRVHASLFGLFVALMLVAFLRAVQTGVFEPSYGALQVVKWVSVLVLLVAVAVDAERRGSPGALLRTTVSALLIYGVLNVSLYFAGVSNRVVSEGYLGAQEPGLMFSLLGLTITRVALPLSGGVNTGGLQSAAGMAIGLVLIWRGGTSALRWAGAVLSLTGAFMVLLTDSRGAMFAAIGAAAATLLLPRILRSQAKWFAFAVPVLPLLLLALLQAIGDQPWVAELSRSGTSSVALLSGRPLIWASILGFLAEFRLEHLVGYGAVGQIASGVSARYGVFFAKNYADPYSQGAHNALLQAILDVGYVGAAVQLLLLWQLLRYFGRQNRDLSAASWWSEVGFAGTICLVLLGLTGETLGYLTPISLLLFLVLNIHCLTTPPKVVDVADLRAAPIKLVGGN